MICRICSSFVGSLHGKVVRYFRHHLLVVWEIFQHCTPRHKVEERNIPLPSQPICCSYRSSTSLVNALSSRRRQWEQWANCQVAALFFSPVSAFVCPAIIILINDTNRHLISPMLARVSCLCFSLIC